MVRVLSDVPSEPQQLAVAETGADWLRVQWLAPSDSGDCELTGYVVRTQQKGQRSWREAARLEATSSAAECCISGLQTGAEYALRVAAVNELGDGDALQRPVRVALPYSAPPESFGAEPRGGVGQRHVPRVGRERARHGVARVRARNDRCAFGATVVIYCTFSGCCQRKRQEGIMALCVNFHR